MFCSNNCANSVATSHCHCGAVTCYFSAVAGMWPTLACFVWQLVDAAKAFKFSRLQNSLIQQMLDTPSKRLFINHASAKASSDMVMLTPPMFLRWFTEPRCELPKPERLT